MILQQKPIVVDVSKQPPITPEIGMADVVLGALGLTGVIMLAALVAGLIAGGFFILHKRKRDRSDSSMFQVPRSWFLF